MKQSVLINWALLLVAIFNIIGVTVFDALSANMRLGLWLAVDVYVMVVLMAVAIILFKKGVLDQALSILMALGVLSIFVGNAVQNSDFWLFIDIFVISIALLSVLKNLILKV